MWSDETRGVADVIEVGPAPPLGDFNPLILLQQNFTRSISEPVEIALIKPTPDMWDKVLTTFRRTLDKSEMAYTTKVKSKFSHSPRASVALTTGFGCTDDENTHALAILRRHAWQALRAKIDEQTADTAIIGKLRMHFEERSHYDEAGIPWVWVFT